MLNERNNRGAVAFEATCVTANHTAAHRPDCYDCTFCAHCKAIEQLEEVAKMAEYALKEEEKSEAAAANEDHFEAADHEREAAAYWSLAREAVEALIETIENALRKETDMSLLKCGIIEKMGVLLEKYSLQPAYFYIDCDDEESDEG